MRPRSAFLAALASLGIAFPIEAHQPVMDMAPRWQGGYGVQVRHEYRFSDEVLDGDDGAANPFGRERTVHTTWLEAIYTFRRELRATVKIPIVHQERVSAIGGRAVRSDGTGLGDVILGLPLRKYWNLSEWTANVGFTPSVRLPTGSTRDGYPVGDGSTDMGLSVSFSTESFRLYSLVDLFYWRNGNGGAGIRPGDELGLDVNLGLHPWHRNDDDTGLFVMLDLEARRQARGRDDLAFRTGGERVTLGPILVGYRGNWMARAEAKFPVWERTFGSQVSRGVAFQLGVGVTF